MVGNKSIIFKILLGLGIAVAVVGLAFLAGPRMDLFRDRLRSGDQVSPSALSSRMIVAVEEDRPVCVWYGLHTNYRNQFKEYFDKVRDGSAPVEAWVEAGKTALGVDSADELRKLDDQRMFRVWWRLKDRTVVGFRLPKFLEVTGSEIETIDWVKEFLDKAPMENATEGFVLYKVNGVGDVTRFTKDGGLWRLDVPENLPEGM